jgi:hypothetical protein
VTHRGGFGRGVGEILADVADNLHAQSCLDWDRSGGLRMRDIRDLVELYGRALCNHEIPVIVFMGISLVWQ